MWLYRAHQQVCALVGCTFSSSDLDKDFLKPSSGESDLPATWYWDFQTDRIIYSYSNVFIKVFSQTGLSQQSAFHRTTKDSQGMFLSAVWMHVDICTVCVWVHSINSRMGVFSASSQRNVRRGCQCCPTQNSSAFSLTPMATGGCLTNSQTLAQVCHCSTVCSDCWKIAV